MRRTLLALLLSRALLGCPAPNAPPSPGAGSGGSAATAAQPAAPATPQSAPAGAAKPQPSVAGATAAKPGTPPAPGTPVAAAPAATAVAAAPATKPVAAAPATKPVAVAPVAKPSASASDSTSGCSEEQARRTLRDAEYARTVRFLDEQTPRYHASLAKARAWLDEMRVDPFELRAQGIKGKKKLVELLDSYVRLRAVLPASERPKLMQRIKEVAAITYQARYHDMERVSDKQFKQDSTSYMRAAVLMEQLGLDTRTYRAAIKRVQPRLDGHMGRRGGHQRMAFHWYYEHFGLTEPFPLDQGYQRGVIAKRMSPYAFKKRMRVYELTHEVFIPYEFGEKLDADFFGPEERVYLRHALERLTVLYVMADNADLVAELISCLRYLRFTDSPIYREALAYLLDAQLPEGKWGNYKRYRKKYGDYVDQGFYLHTTAVAIDALTVAFHFRDNSSPL